MRTVTLGDDGSDRLQMPQLGLGTWRFGEHARTRNAEVDTVRLALSLGYRLIDTAEMYGDGGAEEVVGSAVHDAVAAGEVRRSDVTIVSKVLPSNADRAGTIAACERSLRRLQTDTIDLYLLHWRGSHPLAETVAAFEALRSQAKIRFWGVSNFDVSDLEALQRETNGANCAINQVYYSVSQRGIEYDLLPWQRSVAMPTMAYSPIDQGALAGEKTLAAIGRPLGLSAAQVALAWAMRHPDLIAIPKASSEAHLRDNLRAADCDLPPSALADIDARFTPPKRKRRLAMT